MKCSVITAVAAACLSVAAMSTARASTIFSQTFDNGDSGLLSSVISGDIYQPAEDFTLAADATVRSATWRGVYLYVDPLPLPISFHLYIYGNRMDGGTNLPDMSHVLASTTASFTTMDNITDTGLTHSKDNPAAIYQFQANLPATSLESGTRYWFSVLGPAATDGRGGWSWTFNRTNQGTAAFTNGGSDFSAYTGGDFYMTLDDDSIGTTVPLPDTLALLLPLACILLFGRRMKARAV